MSDPLIIACISVIPSTASAIIGGIVLIKQRNLRHEVNSRLTELVEQTSKASHAEGKEEERAEDRARRAIK